MSNYRDQLEQYLSELSIECDACLDIGGSAWPIRKRVKFFECKDYYIMDNGAEKEHRENWNKPDYEVDIQDTDLINRGAFKERFDVVFMLEVAEYLYNPFEAIENVYYMMKDKGIFYCSWPFIYPVHKPIDADRLRYTEKGVIDLLQHIGFRDIKMNVRVAKKGYQSLINFYREEGMHVGSNSSHIGYITEAWK